MVIKERNPKSKVLRHRKQGYEVDITSETVFLSYDDEVFEVTNKKPEYVKDTLGLVNI